jgi:hypothetical protein
VKKILLTFVSAILTISFTAAAFAAHHLPFEYGQMYTLKVSDPAALLAAMQKFRNSPIGKQNPSGVSLNQFIANGESDATHSISVTYPTAAAMDASRKMNAGSPEVAEVGKVFQSVSEPESSGLFMLMKAEIVEGAITSANPVSMSIGLAVTDQAAFMAAIDKLWDSKASKAFPGNRYMVNVMASGESDVTHAVVFQANDMATLMQGFQDIQSSPEMAAYLSNAANFRRIVSRTVGVNVWASPIPSN